MAARILDALNRPQHRGGKISLSTWGMDPKCQAVTMRRENAAAHRGDRFVGVDDGDIEIGETVGVGR